MIVKSDFNLKLESIVSSLLDQKKKEMYDPEKDYLKIPAPNIIEFVSSPQYLNIPTLFDQKRQYQILRDIFQYRCPICNPMTKEAVDCWDKTKTYLESEVLLTWSQSEQDDVCPKCGSTRQELLADGALRKYNQVNAICGMRCTSLQTHVLTDKGLIRLTDLLPSDPVVDQFYPLNNLMVFGENGWEPVSDVYYAGKLPSKKITLTGGMEHIVSRVHPLYGFHNGK